MDKTHKLIPDFFIVGAPKCGTTSLYEYLKQHPDLFLPEGKEIAFFSKDFTKEANAHQSTAYKKTSLAPKTLAQYLDYFSDYKDQKIIGTSSPWDLTSEVDAIEIKKVNPKAKIIIIIREPIGLLKSLHIQLQYTQAENIKSLKKALAAEEERRKNNQVPKTAQRASFLFYREYTKFSKHIQKYQNAFPKEQIKIIIFDDFINDTAKVYEDLLDFLGVDTTFKPDFKIFNATKVSRIHFLNHPLLIASIAKILPKSIRYKLSKLNKKFNTKTAQKESLDPETEKSLKKDLKPELEKTGDLINRDLIKIWKYE